MTLNIDELKELDDELREMFRCIMDIPLNDRLEESPYICKERYRIIYQVCLLSQVICEVIKELELYADYKEETK